MEIVWKVGKKSEYVQQKKGSSENLSPVHIRVYISLVTELISVKIKKNLEKNSDTGDKFSEELFFCCTYSDFLPTFQTISKKSLYYRDFFWK